LHSALTKQRKSDNPIVLGFQGMSQLDALYGKKAETILSQAYTNIVLRTREPRAARHLSELIGKAQLERVRESRPARWFQSRHRTYSTERVVDPVVMESEIQGLKDLHGYFVQQGSIVAIRFSPGPKQKRAPDLIERIIPAVQHRPLDPEVSDEARITNTKPASAKRGRKQAIENQIGLGRGDLAVLEQGGGQVRQQVPLVSRAATQPRSLSGRGHRNVLLGSLAGPERPGQYYSDQYCSVST
jgi:hypothetical protein